MSTFDKTKLPKYATDKVSWASQPSNNYLNRRRRLQVFLFLALLTLKIKMIWTNLSLPVTMIVQIKVDVNLQFNRRNDDWRRGIPFGTYSSHWIFGSGELKKYDNFGR
jgi:hypothetical protein